MEKNHILTLNNSCILLSPAIFKDAYSIVNISGSPKSQELDNKSKVEPFDSSSTFLTILISGVSDDFFSD